MSIAVIIPAYNSMKFFKRTIESVLAQTLPPDEIIVVDDGSTDETASFAESYGPRVRVLHRQRQRQAANRNFGAAHATSEWIAFLDHDDVWTPDKLASQMDVLRKHPEADICYCGRIDFQQHGDVIEFGRTFPAQPAAEIRHTLFEGDVFLPGVVLMRRSTMLTHGGFSPRFKLCEDWDFWLRLYHAGGSFVEDPRVSLQYRLHPENQSKNYLPRHEEMMAIFQERILPYYPWYSRWLRHLRYYSRRTGEAAYGMREKHAPGFLRMMFQSVLCWPFNDFRRHKVLLHMVLTRLGLVSPAKRFHAA